LNPDLEFLALSLKEAFDAYVATVSEYPEDTGLVLGAMNDLHAAVKSFSVTSVDVCGWGNPFSLPDENDEEEPDDDGVVHVEAQYQLKVEDLRTFRAFVIGRAREAGQVPHEDLDSPVAQVYELFAIDGWHPYRYRLVDLKVLKSSWSVRPGR
jgi:hypothetical protein